MISEPKKTMASPSMATGSDYTKNVHCDPSTLTII